MRLVTADQAQRLYGVPARTVRRWIAVGRVVEHRRGRSLLIDTDEIEQLLDLRQHRRHLPRCA
jgi:excisionase family DNA binding protein